MLLKFAHRSIRAFCEKHVIRYFFIFFSPWFLSPKCATGWREIVEVRDLLHAEPAELGAADGASHVVAAAVVHLYDQDIAAGADLRRKKSHFNA